MGLLEDSKVVEQTNATGVTLFSFAFTYDKGSRIKKITNADGTFVNYDYANNDELKGADYSPTNRSMKLTPMMQMGIGLMLDMSQAEIINSLRMLNMTTLTMMKAISKHEEIDRPISPEPLPGIIEID